MKKSYFAIFCVVFLTILFTDYFNHTSYQAIYVTDDCKIGIDFNQNDKISEDEIVDLPNICNFCSDKNIAENEKITGKLSEHEKLYFKIISKKFYEKIFLNSLVRKDNDTYSVDFKNPENILLSQGLALPADKSKAEEFLPAVNKHKNDAAKREIVNFNTKSLKYHKITCEKGKSAKNKVFMFKDELPAKAQPCIYCYSKSAYVNKFVSLKQTITEKIISLPLFNIYLEQGAGVLKPSDKCTSKICRSLKSEIDIARNSIDLAVYDFNSMPQILSALQNAKARGVKIRAVTDYDNIKNDTETIKNLESFAEVIITDANPAKDANRLMHNKFFIFDDKKVWTGSANITNTGLSGFNANNAIVISSEKIAQIYKSEFENFIGEKFHSAKNSQKSAPVVFDNTEISVYFSPQHKVVSTQIIPEVQKAKKYIYVPIFIITHQKLAQELINAKKRGVDVKLIIDATSARNKYSQNTLLRQNNIPVKVENFAGKMHMKTVIIDDEITFLGSMNLTKSGNVYNDENCLKIKNKEVAQAMKNDFTEIWSKIPDKYLTANPAPESPESSGSCFDGIDNDYDGKIDSEDTACKMLK